MYQLGDDRLPGRRVHDRQTIVSLLPPGEFFGVDSLVPDSRHPFRCDAFETSTIGSIKPQVFVETLLGTAYEDFLPGFVASLNFTRQAYIHCIRGIGLDVRRRIALELSNLADRFGSNDSRGILISLAISHANSEVGRSVTDKSLDINWRLSLFAHHTWRAAKFLDFGGNLRCNEAVVAVN